MDPRVITWNLFHGRDSPPDPGLLTWRSRLLRRTERGPTHAQVNRELLAEFAEVLGRTAWDIALLQECPPRWAAPLAERLGCHAHGVPTSRNSLPALRSRLGAWSPDLLGPAEGGSNLTLVRRGFDRIALRGELVLRPAPALPARLRGAPERRAMALTECGSGLCIANLHATNDRPDLAGGEVLRAAAFAIRRAGERPLVLGGDLNLRPGESPEPFESLRSRYGLGAPTDPEAIDHILARGLEVLEPPAAWPAGAREVGGEGSTLRLSDHAPVEARFALT